MNINKEQILHVYMYRDLYESSYDPNNPEAIPPGKIIFCEACNINKCFEALTNHPERKVIILSCESDYGVFYQEEFHSNKDIYKAYYRIPWDKVEQETKYVKLELRAMVDGECNPSHRFSCKIDGMTACTFNEIPENVVAWFCCNANINDKRAHFLPFGMNSYGEGKDIILKQAGVGKALKKLFYVNFDVNTYDRMQHKTYFRGISRDSIGWMTFIDIAVPISDFYRDISFHHFICGIQGNGLDLYKNYESLYLGCVPIVVKSRWSYNMFRSGFPLLLIDNFNQINERNLLSIVKQIDGWEEKFDTRILTKDYWFNKIKTMAMEI